MPIRKYGKKNQDSLCLEALILLDLERIPSRKTVYYHVRKILFRELSFVREIFLVKYE